ncbi:hypothetical protein [Dapis sp. BLCC M229]|uniref:hypothetical protein n=1 Tax=Dapis sp. BLCC M229 TaxID=3400188 RepID=UPI003CE67AF7
MYGEGKEEGRRKKEEALREGKTLNMVNISPAFTQTIPTDMISILISRNKTICIKHLSNWYNLLLMVRTQLFNE